MLNFEEQIQIVLNDSNFSTVQLLETDNIKQTFNICIAKSNTIYEIEASIDKEININELEPTELRKLIAKALMEATNEAYKHTYKHNIISISHINSIPYRTRDTLESLKVICSFHDSIAQTIEI